MVRGIKHTKTEVVTAKLDPTEKEKLKKTGYNARQAIEYFNVAKGKPCENIEIDLHFLKKEISDVKLDLIDKEQQLEQLNSALEEMVREDSDDGVDFEDINEFINDNQDSRDNAWRKEVLERDKVCQCCGFEKSLTVHHINGCEEYPNLRFDTGNGIVLCQFCHDKYHTVFGLKNVNCANFAKFIKRFGISGKIIRK